MKEIHVNTKIPNLGWHISATMECEEALKNLGITYVSIKTPRCSHTGDFYLFDENKELFENEILGNCIIGTYRKFFFGRHTIGNEIVDGSYYVSFRPKNN